LLLLLEAILRAVAVVWLVVVLGVVPGGVDQRLAVEADPGFVRLGRGV